MGDEQAREIAREAAEEVVKRMKEGGCGACRFPISTEEHDAHHDFLAALTGTLHRLNEVKWSTIKAVSKAVAVCLAFAVLYLFWPWLRTKG